jgi:hypothetical protein
VRPTQLREFEQKANEVIAELRSQKPEEATVIHHDYADGLCSAAVTRARFGIADGHQYAASVIVPMDKKEMLAENAEKIIKNR